MTSTMTTNPQTLPARPSGQQQKQRRKTVLPSTASILYPVASFPRLPQLATAPHQIATTMRPSPLSNRFNVNVGPTSYGALTFAIPSPHSSNPSLSSRGSNHDSLISQSLAAAQQMMNHGQQQQLQQVVSPRSPIGGAATGQQLMMTAVANQFLSNATIVSNTVPNSSASAASSAAVAGALVTPRPAASPPQVITTAPMRSSVHVGIPRGVVVNGVRSVNNGAGMIKPQNLKSKPQKRDRRHSIPASIILTSPQNAGPGGPFPPPPTHPVPEFLCHLYSMLSDPALTALISWTVPLADESTHSGGGRQGVGKIVVHDPTRLQNEVLGNYYRHSKYSSFQRQLNYFGFKKRLHGSKKGKMCPCSFVHDTLGTNPQSLLNLKRRPPCNKRNSSAPTLLLSHQAITTHGIPKNSKKIWGNVASGIHPISATNVTSNANNNASWGIHQAQSAVAQPAPLNIPIMAQAVPPGSVIWPPPSNIAVPTSSSSIQSSFPDVDMINSSPSCAPSTVNNKNYMSMVRDANNAAVLEAKKSLQQNFLKSQQEQQRRADVEPTRISQPSLPLQRSHVFVVQQQHQQQPQVVQPQVVQPQVVQPQTVVPNQFPSTHPFGAENGSMLSTRLPAEQASSSASNDIKNSWMGQFVKPSLPANTISAANLVNAPQANPFLGSFPINTQLLGNNHSAVSDNMMTASSASTNYLMSPTMASTKPQIMPPMTTFPMTNTTINMENQNPQGGLSMESDQDFNELLFNLLSTALPPSDELFDQFDDDMSAGNTSDIFDEACEAGAMGGHLQVADDGGMLLPP